MIRRFGIAIVMAVAATMLVGTSAASAEPQLLRVALYGENIATGGDHAYCRGAYGVRMVSPVGKRGVVRMTLLSHGFRGDGAAWKRDPHCRFLAIVSYTSSRTLFSENVIPVSFSSRQVSAWCGILRSDPVRRRSRSEPTHAIAASASCSRIRWSSGP